MELTRKDVAGMVGLIKANYTYAYKDVTKEDMLMLIESWFTSLSRYDKAVINIAFQRAIESCKMPPTLADILQQVETIKRATEPTEAELWDTLNSTLRKVSGCVYRFGFNAVESNGLTQGANARNECARIWESLPQILKDYCGSENGLINLSRLGGDELSFEKGRFLKVLPTLKTRIEIKESINPNILALAGGTLKELESSIDVMLLKDTK